MRCEPTRVVSVNNSDQKLAPLLENEELLTLSEVGDRLGIVITRVYDLLRDRKFIAWQSPEGARVPATFFNDKGVISKHVTAVITVLTDGGWEDEEILTHLFSEDESLPGRPIDGLHGHLAREVIRRAQASAI